jgi:hypothetical protein
LGRASDDNLCANSRILGTLYGVPETKVFDTGGARISGAVSFEIAFSH